MASLKSEIAQKQPFSSIEQEALLNLLRTSDCLHRAIQQKTREWGLTSTQYNVLRILRGAGTQGLACAAVGERLVTAEPDITRLLARLKGLKLVRQHRDRRDRRVVLSHITSAGLALLRAMDPAVQRAPKDLLGHLSMPQLAQMIRLLERARQRCSCAQPATGAGASP